MCSTHVHFLYPLILYDITFSLNVTTRKIVKKYIWRGSQILLRIYVYTLVHICARFDIYKQQFFPFFHRKLASLSLAFILLFLLLFSNILCPGCVIQLQQNNWTNVVGKIVSAAGKLILRALICGNCSRIRPR